MKMANILFQIRKTPFWMMDPVTANAALGLFEDMVGAARLKSKHPIVEYDMIDDEDLGLSEDYHHFYLTNGNYQSIPQGYRIAVIRNEGVMMRDDSTCDIGTRSLAAMLEKDDADDKVIGTILLVDSGGGASDSVRPLVDVIANSKKPVIAYCDGAMCSAAYFAASYCDMIIAHDKRNLVGCIGTMIEFADFPSGAKDQNGRIRLRIYADGSEEKNSEFEEALQGNTQLIKENLLNPLAQDFRNEVKKNRVDVKDEQLKGRTFFAQDVVGTLIDGIGNMEDVVSQIVELTQLNITNMTGFDRLQSLDTCRDLQMVDGFVSMNGEQLAEIEATLNANVMEASLNEVNVKTIQEQTEEIGQLKTTNEALNNTIAERDKAIAERDTIIEELRTQLAESNPGAPSEATHLGNHKTEEGEMSPMDYCRHHEQMFH